MEVRQGEKPGKRGSSQGSGGVAGSSVPRERARGFCEGKGVKALLRRDMSMYLRMCTYLYVLGTLGSQGEV